MVKSTQRRNDILLAAVIIILSIAALAAFPLFSKPGEQVIVTIDGKEISRYSLSESLETDITSEDGKTNRLVIDDGAAYVSYADCPDKICVSHRKISREGETIVCLPHKLVVSIEPRRSGG